MEINRRVITVGELTAYIKGIFERDVLLNSLWIKGEISNLKQASSGHIYFTLKDSVSCLKTVMFRSRAGRLLFIPENGMSVRVRGYVSVYERDGSYQLYAEELEPDGIGALYIAFEQLKEKLQREGLFYAARKRQIPSFPERIGLVTSPTGAAVRDMIEIIGRRWPGAVIILAPVAVQGDAAPGEVSRGISILNQLGNVDVLIVGRGGGSLEELWAFNTEEVARAIYLSKIPVISAVGHETDYTIADMVADLRAPTPSAAAELVVPVRAEVAYNLETLRSRMKRALREQSRAAGKRLDNCLQSRVLRRPYDIICRQRHISCDSLEKTLLQSINKILSGRKGIFGAVAGRLNTLSPLATMARGYSVCIAADSGRIISDSSDISTGDRVKVELHRGSIECKVEKAEDGI